MNGLFEAAFEVQTFMQARSWSFCLIGGLAVIRWGEPRMTQDIDLSLLTCSAGDVIILKAFADRTKDWMDIEGILIRQFKQLEIEYIFDRLNPLCDLKEAPEIPQRLKTLIATIDTAT